MINTILMVSINFLLRHQKAAVALSLSWPRACFGKPLGGSCWIAIVRFSLVHAHNSTCGCPQHARAPRHALVSYGSTRVHYYTLALPPLRLSHTSHTDKQIECDFLNLSFRLLVTMFCNDQKTLFRAPEIQLCLFSNFTNRSSHLIVRFW